MNSLDFLLRFHSNRRNIEGCFCGFFLLCYSAFRCKRLLQQWPLPLVWCPPSFQQPVQRRRFTIAAVVEVVTFCLCRGREPGFASSRCRRPCGGRPCAKSRRDAVLHCQNRTNPTSRTCKFQRLGLIPLSRLRHDSSSSTTIAILYVCNVNSMTCAVRSILYSIPSKFVTSVRQGSDLLFC